MKTSHQLARELLAGLDLPIWHFDPSRAGLDDERDTSLSEPNVEINNPLEGLSEEDVQGHIAEGGYMGNFITICGETAADGEAISEREAKLREAVQKLIKADPTSATFIVGDALQIGE